MSFVCRRAVAHATDPSGMLSDFVRLQEICVWAHFSSFSESGPQLCVKLSVNLRNAVAALIHELSLASRDTVVASPDS